MQDQILFGQLLSNLQLQNGMEVIDMYNIDEIMDMLDWNNSVEMQNEGIRLAENIKSINVFLLPANPNSNKNVWDNCAKILCGKSDDILNPYLIQLLEWIEDLNWPGSLIVLDRLKKYTEVKFLAFAVKECVKRAIAMDDQIWLENVSELLDNKKLASVLEKDISNVLFKRRNIQ